MSLIYFLLSGQSDPMAMKLKLDMSCHLLNVCHVYTKLQIDISKYVEKSLENFKKNQKCAKIITKIQKIFFYEKWTYVKKYVNG